MRAARFRAGLGPDGNPVAWINRVIGIDQNPPADPAQTVRGLHQVPYAVANQLFDFHLRQTHVPTGVGTSVGRSQNEFYLESFMDELAHAAGKDPYHYRRALLDSNTDFPRAKAWVKVLDTAAEKSGWGRNFPREPPWESPSGMAGVRASKGSPLHGGAPPDAA